MANLAAYEKQIDKLIAKAVEDVIKELKTVSEVITRRVGVLATEVGNVKVPQGIGDKDLEEIPTTIKELLARHNGKFAQGLVKLKLEPKVDGGEVSVNAFGIAGALATY